MMLSVQPPSLQMSVSAPVALMHSTLSFTMAPEISPYLTAKVPPNPQQRSGALISARVTPGTVVISERGSFEIPMPRLRWQGSW